MQWLAAICVRRPVFATVIILLFVVVGIAGYTNLSVDRFPKVDAPMVTVTTTLEGASPTEIETEITDKREEAVNTISGIDDLSSTSSEGVSVVSISFVLEKDSDIAAQEVRDRINRILGELPEDTEQPKVEKMDPDSAPIMSLSLVSGRRDVQEEVCVLNVILSDPAREVPDSQVQSLTWLVAVDVANDERVLGDATLLPQLLS